MKLTDDNLLDFGRRGAFIDAVTGEIVRETPPAFPICAGPWPNPNVGARQMRCCMCKEFVGVSPRGYGLHKENPEARPILCQSCIVPFVNHLKEALEAKRKPE